MIIQFIQKKYQEKQFMGSLKRISERRKEKLEGDFVYLLECKGYYKIGHTGNIDNRLNAIRCGNPFEVELIVAKRHIDAEFLERNLHWQYGDNRTHREWFKLDEKEVSQVISHIL